jgi:catechol 2,3-dioxygenase-like lactoylglutathione lyase family enzyme
MIDHIDVQVTDLEQSVAFYTKALAPLGYVLIMRFPETAGFGVDGKPDLWLRRATPGDRVHVAIRAAGRGVVRAFHEAAIAAGGKDHGAPGVRELYHPNYFAAFVRDPDGHNIEAVCHDAYLG